MKVRPTYEKKDSSKGFKRKKEELFKRSLKEKEVGKKEK